MKELSIELARNSVVSLKLAFRYLPAHMRENGNVLPLLIRQAEAHYLELVKGVKEQGK